MKWIIILFISFSVTAQSINNDLIDDCSNLLRFKSIENLKKNDLKIEKYEDMNILYKTALSELCLEWQKVKPKQDLENCFVFSQNNRGCNIVTGKMIEFFGSHLINDGKVKFVGFGQGYYTKIIYFKDKIYSSNDTTSVLFENHIVATVTLKNDSTFVLDKVISDSIPTLSSAFYKHYINLAKKKILFYEKPLESHEDCKIVPLSIKTRSIDIKSTFNIKNEKFLFLKKIIKYINNLTKIKQ